MSDFGGLNPKLPASAVQPRRIFVSPIMVSQDLIDAATIRWDFTKGGIATVTLGGNRTIANPTNLAPGTYILHVLQDAVGSRTLTWGSVFKWVLGPTAPVLTTTASARDIFSFVSDGTFMYGSLLKDVQ